MALTVPATLGNGGVERVLEWELAPSQAAGLSAGAELVRAAAGALP